MSDEIERMIATIGAALQQRPDYPYNLIGLAEMVAARKAPRRAADLAREAMALGRDDPATLVRGRRLLASLIPGYHVPMMNDARRNAAWDAALRRAIRPGMTVLEIGTGAGMLALMAARAGAAKVVTCEYNPVAAGMARDLAARNGYADRIQVVAKRSQALTIGKELDRPADLLVCDIFADGLLDFDPLGAIADARQRLLAPGAPAVPMAASLCAALVDWRDYPRAGHIDAACGFDLSPMADFVPTSILRPIGSAGVDLVSEEVELFRFDFAQERFPPSDRRILPCRAILAGEANTIARWIRLELDDETMIEARPEPGAVFFSGLTMTPLDAPVSVEPGETITIGAAHDGRAISTWVERG
ncbi:MAG: 50S ribosomal protein L11 methyltransferase [Sphingomonas sp.]|uniref:50S ribosomal protein L11 methyltransferase n=1 Tax=Sphingomonas sp. TaxID=28214 RepID=UPI003569FBE0